MKIGPLARSPTARSTAPGGPRRERDGDGLAALAHDGQGPMSSLDAEGLDVGPDRFGDPQPVERQQGDQRVLAGRAEPSGDEHRSDLVAIRADGMGFVVKPWAADMDCRRMGNQAFLLGVAVEAGDGAQPSGDGGRRPTPSLKGPQGKDSGLSRFGVTYSQMAVAGEVAAVEAQDFADPDAPDGHQADDRFGGQGAKR